MGDMAKWWRTWPFSLLLVIGMLLVCTSGTWWTWLQTTTHEAAPTVTPSYQEGAFGDWADTDKNGCTQQVDALSRDLNNEARTGCTLTGGWLTSPYTGLLLEPGHDGIALVVNHIVPERWAWVNGAWKWDREARSLFYNDLDNLVVVEAGVQRAKAGQGPEDWLPDLETCFYTQRFVDIAKRYGLRIPVETEGTLSIECESPIPGKVKVFPWD